MPDDDEALDRPFLKALVVPGTMPDTEAVELFVAWVNFDEACRAVAGVLPQAHAQVGLNPKFGGEIVVIVATEFLTPLPPADEIARLTKKLQDRAAKLKGKRPVTLTLRLQKTVAAPASAGDGRANPEVSPAKPATERRYKRGVR